MSTRRGLLVALAGLAAGAGTARAQGTYEAATYEAAARWGVDGASMWRTILCESGGDPSAVSNRLNVNGTPDVGLAQFNVQTWEAWSASSGMYGDIWNGFDQIELMAWAWSLGLQTHWSCWWMV